MKITVRGKAFFAAGISLVFFINVKGGETGAAAVAYSFDSSQVSRPSGFSSPASANSAPVKTGGGSREEKSTDTAQTAGCELLGGNLPKILGDRGKPYLVTSDVYVPSGKTVRIEPGVVILFKNFTEMHVEGRLVAEGTTERPIVFSSELDKTFNPSSTLHANPYDWNGISIHENGLGSSFSNVKLLYSVFGINSLTKYIKLDKMFFSNNGRSDLVIEGKDHTVTTQPFTYALTIDDARKDGVPVKILMDPRAKKRNIFKYFGATLLIGGGITSIWSGAQLRRDMERLHSFSDVTIADENSNLVKNGSADWEKARSDRNRDIGVVAASSLLAILGGVGFGYSFTF